MKRRLPSLLVFPLLAVSHVFAQANPSVTLGPASEHSFDIKIRYHESVQTYVAPVLPANMAVDPKTVGQPERAIGELFVAAQKHKYSAWLSKWDDLSQQSIEKDRTAKGMTPEAYLASQFPSAKTAAVVRQAFRGPYVFFVVRSGSGERVGFAFKPSDKGWLATKEVDWEAQAIAADNF